MKRKSRIWLTIGLLSLAGVIVFTIALGQKKSFNNMLNLLLSKNTPTVKVPQAYAELGTAYFLDARELNEYEISHIKGARYVGVSDYKSSRIKDIPKDAPVIIYCSVGKRSEDLTLKLKKEGYSNIRNMYGGIFEWINEGHPVYNMKGKQTLNVHAFNKFWGKWLEKGTKVYE